MGELSISIIGYGNWGVSLAHALMYAGVPPREVIVRKMPHGAPPALNFVKWAAAQLDADIMWLCVPDGSVGNAAAQLAERCGTMKNRIVLHSSGALTIAALNTAKAAGAGVAAIHPVMTFPVRRSVPLAGVLFGVESQRAVQPLLFNLVRKLGGRPFAVSSSRKPLYHAAATMASPLIVSALAAAMHAAKLAGVSEPSEFVAALAQASAANVFAHGPEQSFSGPFARGDVETIELHLQALASHPMLTEVYRALGQYAAGSLPVTRRRELQALLKRRERLVSKGEHGE